MPNNVVFYLFFSTALTNSHQIHSVSGRATIYSTYSSGRHRATCNNIDPSTGRSPCRRCFFDTQTHIASRTIALGTHGVICNLRTNMCVRTRVMDRGPYGAIIPCKEINDKRLTSKLRKLNIGNKCYYYQVQIKLRSGWKRRGKFDLTLPVARAIHHHPFDMVIFIYAK